MLCSVQRFQVTQSYQPVPLSLSNVNCHAIAYSWKWYVVVMIANANCHAIPILKYGAVVMESAEEGLTY